MLRKNEGGDEGREVSGMIEGWKNAWKDGLFKHLPT